ncbi:MAG: OstA-like protein [candidate division WOR-3 bacterium]
MTVLYFSSLLAPCCLIALTPFRADRVEIVRENNESIVYLFGNVIIEQESTIITCLEAELNETRGNVILKDSILITNPDGRIRANNATYYFESKSGLLTGDVSLYHKEQIFTADSLNYDGLKKIVRMRHNIKIEDLQNKQIAYGEDGWYEIDNERGALTQSPYLEILREDKSPIVIKAREFFLLNSENKFFGYDSIEGIIDSITIFCDTIEYNLKNEQGFLKRPVVKEKNNELRGDSGEFLLKDKDIEYFKVYNGKGDYWTQENSHNLVEGSMITIQFEQSRAKRVIVEGNPKGLLKLKEKQNAKD